MSDMRASFQPVGWSHTTNIYEVNLRQYTQDGSFEAFGRELPRLRDMGIEILWFMPVTPISVEKRKGSLGSYYACSDYTRTNPEFGTEADFKKLVDSAHAMGFKILIDWVANHTGWDHRWTREHPDYYRKNYEGQFFEAHGWEDVIDLNYDNNDLQEAMINAMKWWVEEFDLDGFRCDMAMLVPLDFWRKARTALDAVKPLFWLAECEEIAYHEVFDATYTWKFLHKMEQVWRKESGLPGLDEVLDYYREQFPVNAFRAYFTSNHDENSHSGSEYERMGAAAKAFAVLCCTWDGLPLIYSGQELPNEKRLLFFDKDCIPWSGLNKLHDFYKVLLGLRKTSPAMAAGDMGVKPRKLEVRVVPVRDGAAGGYTGTGTGTNVTGTNVTGTGVTGTNVTGTGVTVEDAGLGVEASDRVFAFIRKHPASEVLVILNFSPEALMVRLDDPLVQGIHTCVFSGATTDLTTNKTVAVAEWGYQVLVKTPE